MRKLDKKSLKFSYLRVCEKKKEYFVKPVVIAG